MFRFAVPVMLYGLGIIPILILFLVFAFRMKKRAMERFGRLEILKHLSNVSRRLQYWKASFFLLALLFLVLGLARPQFGTKLRNVQREGQDIVIALDVSLSMMAEDIQPNRLEKAKHEIASLIDRLEGDRVALIAFSGTAFVQCPLTLDYGAAKMFLDVMGPDLIPIPGTAVEEAIGKAIGAFVEKERKHKVLILITDGEDHVGDPVEMAKEAAKQGVVIYTVGIGSVEGVPIPIFNERGNRIGFKKDDEGQVVMTRLDELTLEKIALETGGKYYRASPGEVELERIYEDISRMDKKALSSKEYAQFEDRFQPFLVAVLFFLVLELILPERHRIRKEWKGRFE